MNAARLALWRQARDILCVRLDQMGDVLMCTPAMRALKNADNRRRLTLLSSSSGAMLAPYLPELEAAIAYGAPWMKSADIHDSKNDLDMVAAFQARRFDAAVIFSSYTQSALPAALLCTLAGIPLRLAHCRENPYQLLTDWVPDPEPDTVVRHEVRRQIDLVASVGCSREALPLSFRVPAADKASIRRRLESMGIARGQPWVVLHTGASAASRRYPARLWAIVARQLRQRLGCMLVFTGSSDEAEAIASIRREAACDSPLASRSLAGELDLGKLAALIAQAPVVVSNNTGPAHLCAALGTPVVDLYALTNPQHTPWQVVSRVLFADVPCRFCLRSVCPHGHHACLAGVAPGRVVAAVAELLQCARRAVA